MYVDLKFNQKYYRNLHKKGYCLLSLKYTMMQVMFNYKMQSLNFHFDTEIVFTIHVLYNICNAKRV